VNAAGPKGKKTLSTLKDSRAGINSATKAKSWLIKEELLIEGEAASPTALSQALMWLAAGDRNTVEQLVDGMRAVALCLEDWNGEAMVEATNSTIKEVAASWMEEAKKELHRVTEEVTAEAKKKLDSTEGRAERRSWADDMDEEEVRQQTIQGIAKAIPTYAQALASEWRKDAEREKEKVHQNYMAREALRRRKVLIDGIDGVQSAAGGLTPKELVEKANIALAAARIETEGNGMEPAKDPTAIAAKVLENGGVVIELESEEGADWVRSEGVREAFEGNFGGSTKVKDQLFQVVASFLPVTLRDELEGAAPRIEIDNALPTDCIAHCRWLKAPKFWYKGQRFAHAVIGVKGRLEASLLIRHGVLFESQRFKVRKLLEEPKRCFRCQRIGHTAAGCKEIHDICPNCAGAHAGKDCDKSPRDYKCTVCLKAKLRSNHAVWDKECPSMLAEKKKKAERSLDSSYKFFPTKEEWTWERREDWAGNMGSVREAGSRREAWRGGEAEQGRGRTGEPDRGWEGMRAKRALEDVTKIAGSSRQPIARSSRKGKEKDTGEARQTTQASIHRSQEGDPSQGRGTDEPRSSSSRVRQEGVSGRQSVLGEYWTAPAHTADQFEEIQTNLNNSEDSWF
jgi:hypothetical protein